jgi:Flp pilus assembly protein TadG
MRRPSCHRRRRGAALVEFAFVASALLLILFGIFEYARYLFLLQIAENAAREGARFAVVRTGDGTTKQQIIDEVTRRMAGREKEVIGYAVDVINVNPDTGAVISTTWNSAAFGQAIEVRITGSYRPILPVLLKTSSTIPVRVYSMMSSEAN